MKIKKYSFGKMEINGKMYENDLIVFPDKIKSNWWRKKGHKLLIEDLDEVIEFNPEILIIGKGASGQMAVPVQTKRLLKQKGIEIKVMKTNQAYKKFNELIEKDNKVVGAFHLTC